MTVRASKERLWRLIERSAAYASRFWKSEPHFFLALTLFNIFLARRTFKSGIWADNDSVCHYAYVRHLLEDILPATGTFFGFTPKYDLGAPFLLYNTPPGVYVAAAAVVKITGLSALLALKSVMVAAFLSVPLIGAPLAATFEDEPGDLRKFVALSLSLFSSELFGLEFFFKNGMLNPSFALPFLLATLLLFRRVQRASGPRTLVWVALAGAAFAATLFVHLLSAYMLGVALGCCALAEGPRKIGRSVVQIAAVVGLGAGLAAFWLVPSLPFAATEDAAFTWIRRSGDTFANYLDGSMLSSYPVGFYPQFVTYSGVGGVAALCAAFGVWRAVVKRNWAVLSFAVCALLALLVVMGPRPSFGLWILPMYSRLLWYRFATLLELSTLLLAGWGAWQLYEERARLGVVITHALIGGAVWAALVMTQRAVKVETAEDYPQFVVDVSAASAWLRAHGKPGGRVFSEFLGQDVVDSAGVNYARHLIPMLSSYPEAGGWIYENDLAAQAMLKRGLLWYNPFPMIALAERYDVQYIVAGSPNFVRVLGKDPRWRMVLPASHVSLFEAVGREPSVVDGGGRGARVRSERYLVGGGYEYVVEVDGLASGEKAGQLLLKTSWSSAWHAHAGARELAVHETDDALLAVDLPESSDPTTVTLRWDISASRATGNRVSLAALILAGILVLLGTRWRPSRVAIPDALPQWLGLGGAGAALFVCALRARPIDENVVGFGIKDGMAVTFDAKRLEVGQFDDDESFRPTHLLQAAWGERTLMDGRPARVLSTGEAAATVALSPSGANLITVKGTLRTAGEAAAPADAPLLLVFREPVNHTVVCRLDATLGTAARLADECVSGLPGEGPGVTREMEIHAAGTLEVQQILVDTGMVFVEAEQMHNVLDDGGYEAFYTYGPVDQFSSNGVSMVARPTLERPIALDREIALPEQAYDMWILTRSVSSRLENGRAHFLVESDGRKIADLDTRTRHYLPFWDNDAHLEWMGVGRVEGGASRRVRVTFHRVKTAFDGLGDLDALAFAPLRDH
jgi:hypothetical protein